MNKKYGVFIFVFFGNALSNHDNSEKQPFFLKKEWGKRFRSVNQKDNTYLLSVQKENGRPSHVLGTKKECDTVLKNFKAQQKTTVEK